MCCGVLCFACVQAPAARVAFLDVGVVGEKFLRIPDDYDDLLLPAYEAGVSGGDTCAPT